MVMIILLTPSLSQLDGLSGVLVFSVAVLSLQGSVCLYEKV